MHIFKMSADFRRMHNIFYGGRPDWISKPKLAKYADYGIQAQFCWALPVKVEELGAHLEAYIELQPIFTTLRLCNRFGRGPNAAIAELPAELITYLEDILMREEREDCEKEWTKLFNCW